MTATEKEIKKIFELAEKGNTIEDIAKNIGRHRSTVSKYLSDDYEGDNKKDEKTGKNLTDLMIEELDFEEGIIPLVYKLKNQANEIDVNLFDYLTDISDTMSKFLRITYNPEWFYYVFMGLASNLSVYTTNNIEANDLMNAIDNFYNREISMEESENFLTENEAKAERLLSNTKEELNDLNKQINEAQKELTKMTSLNTIMLNKMISDPNKKKLKISEENLINMGNQMKKLQNYSKILTEKCKLLDKDNLTLKQKLSAFNIVYNKLYKLFPQEIEVIIQETENEIQ